MEEKTTVSYEISRDDFNGVMAIMKMTSKEIANVNSDELWQKLSGQTIPINTLFNEDQQDKLAQFKFSIVAIAIACVVKEL